MEKYIFLNIIFKKPFISDILSIDTSLNHARRCMIK
jgi:hypothetical protein